MVAMVLTYLALRLVAPAHIIGGWNKPIRTFWASY